MPCRICLPLPGSFHYHNALQARHVVADDRVPFVFFLYVCVCVYTHTVVKNLPVRAGDVRDMGSIPALGKSGGGNGNLLQYSCLGISTDQGALRAIVHGVEKSQTQLSN